MSGKRGVLHGIHISDVVVHDVTGTPKAKDTGLVVIGPGARNQRFDDVLLDGVTACRTSQWAGILVGGAKFGTVPEEARSTNVVVRNCTVHDVQGDGIILFEVTRGRIENSVAWHTGMQDTETIGTPNAIWTWMCRDCTVERSEAFLSDSPGVDGGAFDIDYGNDNNIVASSYGHDTQGYCIAIFGAGWETTNSVVRHNVCADNGRSPRLARRQGAIFLYTWNKGKLDGVVVENNRVFWNPSIEAAALVNRAVFNGRGSFAGNTLRTSSSLIVESNESLDLDRNRYERKGVSELKWRYGSKLYTGLKAYKDGSGQEARSQEEAAPAQPEPAGSVGRLLSLRLPGAASLEPHGDRWLLVTFVPPPEAAGPSDRGQVTLLRSAHRQFRSIGLDAVVVAGKPAVAATAENLKYDWQLGDTALLFYDGEAPLQATGLSRLPGTILVDPKSRIVWTHDGLTAPGDLGLALRSFLGPPDYARLSED